MDFILFMKKIKNTIRLSFAIIALLLAGCSNNSLNTNSNSLDSSDTTSETSSGISSETSSETTSNSGNNSNSSSNSETSQGGSQEYDGYYASISSSMSGSALSNALKSIVPISNTKRSYDWSRYENADEALDDSTSILCLYTRHNIKKSSHVGSYSWNTWNREHIWTQTAYPNSNTDNHNIFACEGQINNYRGNLPFNEVTHSSTTRLTVFDHVTDCYRTSSYFEPCDEAKGEVARSVMYGVVMYDYTITKMIPVNVALKWNSEHPVTEREIRRNNIVQKLQGNRNPFVDHPEFADKIWG